MRVISNIEFIHQQEIGQQGANSRVFRTIDPQLGSQIAVKQIQKARMAHFDDYFREAQMLHASAHPNVVEVKFASHDDDNVYIAMPFYANGSLKSVLNQKFLTVREIVKISIEFLTGLQHIHFKNLIHYDIKPANILFDNSNRAMISDFGLAQWVNNVGVADVDAFYGKHLVPEATISGAATIQADIFQVGMTLYRMCNGEVAFQN